ncbi:MAG: hypothetical protein J5826_02860 [Bacteroidales bacterium]|nr:hypothetical protein [Bacteroidales bacterium]
MPTAQEIKDIIAENRKEIYKKDYTFFEVDTFAKCVDYVERESANCPECRALLNDMAELAKNYPEMLNSGSSGRDKFQMHLSTYTSHLSEKHGYKRKGIYMPIYTMAGIAVGALLGWITGYYLICMASGMILGYIIGTTLDRRSRRNGKTF